MKEVRFVLFTLAITSAACGDDGGRPVTIVDGGGGSGDAAPANCLLPASLGTVTPTVQEGHSAILEKGGTTPDNYYLYADLNADAQPDVLLLDLYAGFGAFSGGFPTGGTTVQLTGEESGYDSCGACVLGLTDYTEQGPTGDPYFANGGTLNLTSVSSTSLAGSLINVTLRHVTIAEDNTTTAHADGCTSSLASLNFSATPEPDTAFTSNDTKRRWRLKIER